MERAAVSLALNGVRKAYGGRVAVEDLTLDIRAGEVFGLLGPNGAGKTTTLKMVAGLVIPDRGSIHICGVDALADPDRAKSRLSYVPDEPTLYPRLTGREFLRFAGRLRDLDTHVIEERIRFHEELFGMAPYLDSRSEVYSHGMIQRVVLAAAFLAKPELYVIDEPLVGLDPPSAETFHAMARAAADAGAAMLLSTHTLPVAARFCDRIGILHGGRLMRTMPVEEIPGGELERIFFEITGTGPSASGGYFTTR